MKKLLFIPIPKNASTTMRHAVSGGNPKPPHGHFTALEAKGSGHKKGLVMDFPERTVIAVCRDPYDRMFSWWSYRAYQAVNSPVHNRPFRDFLFDVILNKHDGYRKDFNWKTTQKGWTCDEEGRSLVHHLLRFESIVEDWNALWEKDVLPETCPRNLIRLNETPSGNENLAPEWDEEMLELVESHFAEDFPMFGYKMRSKKNGVVQDQAKRAGRKKGRGRRRRGPQPDADREGREAQPDHVRDDQPDLGERGHHAGVSGVREQDPADEPAHEREYGDRGNAQEREHNS